ncbi:MAG TPA: MaoC/PaaZ C-terminal domain-containing protein [Smithella sp.]|nr:MaoC/PaaZ C-terminal domain-containing protein [Smithella sp.]HRS96897.1 MaoC/PaaZ C-terminal domain-containing protein [Smithella sp.]
MANQWTLLKTVVSSGNGNIEATAEVPPDSPWFSGHFPGEPILPGIALIHIVEQTIAQEAAGRGILLKQCALKRVKFMQPVRPGDALSVSVRIEEAEKNFLFSFKIAHRENLVCSGSLAARKINQEGGGR